MAQSRLSTFLSSSEKEGLRKKIEALGFHRVGFTDSSVLAQERDYLENRGPGPFEPTDLPPRTDPRLMLDSARSVIAVAQSYHHPDPEKPPGARGRLSKYCRGIDYHELMLEALQKIAQFIKAEYGAESLCYVDTGPPLERAFAQKAGLGRLGKNTNLILPKLGSWVFLGMMVTELAIPPDEAATYSICGSCRLCLDACPTACITEWAIDSEACLGYLNQKSDEVPLQHREAMGDWLFGCDICQDVCPHNVKAKAGLSPDYAPLPMPGAFPDLGQMAQMKDEEFEQWFRPTAADWRGPEAIRRNAFVALGNSDCEEAVDILIQSFPRGDHLLEEHARWAAVQLSERFPHRAPDLSEIRIS